MNCETFTHAPRRRPLAAALAIAFALASMPAWSDQSAAPRARTHDGADFRARLSALAANGRLGAPLSRLLESPQGPPPVQVTNCDDSGPGSLREAYFNAVDGTTIDLTQLTCSTISLTTGALTNPPSAASVQLEGPGKYALTIDAGHNGRVLVHNGADTLSITGLTITNGSYSGIYGGGCIYSYGNVNVIYSLVSQCSMSSSGTAKAYGGAIYAKGDVGIGASVIKDSTAHAAAANSAGAGIWANGVQVLISTVSGNTVSGDGSHYSRGGGVFALGDASIKYSTITDNEAESGGGVFLLGASTDPMQVSNSTISGNHASGAAGGIYAKYRPFSVINSTITQNTAVFDFGAGLYLAYATEIQSSIVANNSSQDGLHASDIGGVGTVAISGANNLIIASTLPLPPDTITLQPMLGPLQNNGGYTMTHALLPGSPAIDHGNNVHGNYYDQRGPVGSSYFGYERVVGPSADIGAFEAGAPDHIFVGTFDNSI
jgi:hypothetical protein